MKTVFLIDWGNWYWATIGTLLLILWSLLPPFKNYIFKIEHVYQMRKPLIIYARFGVFYEVTPISIDQQLGLELSFVKVTMDFTSSHEREVMGSIRLNPTALDVILHRGSGYLDIIFVENDKLQKTKYLEKIPYGAVGLVLHFAGVDGKNGIFAMLESVRKKASIFDMLKVV